MRTREPYTYHQTVHPSQSYKLLPILVFQFHIAESTPVFITGSRQLVIIVSRSQLNSQQVLLCRCTTDYKCNMIRRTSSRTQSLHFFNKERNQCSRIQYSFRFLILNRSCSAEPPPLVTQRNLYSIPSVASKSICAGRLHLVFTSSYIVKGAF